MPFIGKDWRSDGDQWVKTKHGWERVKVLETILEHINTSLKNNKKSKQENETDDDDIDSIDITDDNIDDIDNNQSELDDENTNRRHLSSISSTDSSLSSSSFSYRQPHVFIKAHNFAINRESTVQRPTVSEVLNGLDMAGAVKDMHRFNYVCKLLELIIRERLREISGNTQRTLFLIIRTMLENALRKNENLKEMRKLLKLFQTNLTKSYCYYFYFHHIGTQQLWQQHLKRVNKWLQIIDKAIESYNQENVITHNEFNMINLPNDCKLEIIRRFNQGLDLINLSKSNKCFYDLISNEILIWKNLCLFHFQQSSINSYLNQSIKNQKNVNMINGDDLDWKALYFRLKRRYGHREVYVDMVHRCKSCGCLFWKEIGHPCYYVINSDQDFEYESEPITPNKLVNLLLV